MTCKPINTGHGACPICGSRDQIVSTLNPSADWRKCFTCGTGWRKCGEIIYLGHGALKYLPDRGMA